MADHDVRHDHDVAMANREIGERVRKQFVPEAIEKVAKDGMEGESRVRRFVISTESPDRDNDTISVSGWKLANFQKNPVVLWAHDYSQLPVARATNVGVVDGKLVADAEFADHAFANTVLRMIDGKFLNATSVGFKPMKYLWNETRGGMDFAEQELLEFSIVPVPANAEALIQLAGSDDAEALRKWAMAVIKSLEPKAEEQKTEPAPVAATESAAVEVPATEVPAAEKTEDTPDPVAVKVAEQVSLIVAAVEKAGRKLSRANETTLRNAQELIGTVLAQLDKQPEPTDDDPEPPADGEKKPKPMTCEHGDGCTACKSFVITFRDDPPKERHVVTLSADNEEPQHELTGDQITNAMRAAFKDMLAPLVVDAVTTAVNRSRGRVD